MSETTQLAIPDIYQESPTVPWSFGCKPLACHLKTYTISIYFDVSSFQHVTAISTATTISTLFFLPHTDFAPRPLPLTDPRAPGPPPFQFGGWGGWIWGVEYNLRAWARRATGHPRENIRAPDTRGTRRRPTTATGGRARWVVPRPSCPGNPPRWEAWLRPVCPVDAVDDRES